MELRWQPAFDVSAMHAAWVISQGRRLMDASLASELQPLVSELSKWAQTWQIPEGVFWRQLLALAADMPNNNELAERMLRRLVGGSFSSASVTALASPIAGCEAVMRRKFPRLVEELALRVGPLQTAWEARGPGLLGMLRSMTEEDFLVESATVLLVQPVAGGDGLSHLQTNRVHMEAVLTNIDHRLPEVLRLAWLLGQLNLDRPMYSESVHGHALAEVAELALVPATLAPASEVQLAMLDEDTIALALEHWLHMSSPAQTRTASILQAWWETATSTDWGWSTSLVALSEMLK